MRRRREGARPPRRTGVDEEVHRLCRQAKHLVVQHGPGEGGVGEQKVRFPPAASAVPAVQDQHRAARTRCLISPNSAARRRLTPACSSPCVAGRATAASSGKRSRVSASMSASSTPMVAKGFANRKKAAASSSGAYRRRTCAEASSGTRTVVPDCEHCASTRPGWSPARLRRSRSKAASFLMVPRR